MSNERDDFQQFGLGPDCTVDSVEKNYKALSLKLHPDKFNAESAQQESELTLKILTRQLTEAELHEVAHGKSIIFKYENKTWLLCACGVELDISEEKPLHFFIQLIDNQNELFFLNSLLQKQQKNGMQETVSDEFVRNELLLIAKAHGRTTLFEASSARFTRLVELREKFNATTLATYKYVYTKSASRLAKKTPSLAQQIKTYILATLDQNVDVVREQYSKSADNFKSFVRGWIRLVANFSHYLSSNGVINEQSKDKIIEFVCEAVSLVFKTYLCYVKNQVSLETFSKGHFILSVLLESLTEHTVLLTKFIRQNMAAYELLNITQLNNLQIEKIKDAITTTDALVSIDTALLSMTLIEMPLSDGSLIESLIKNGVSPYDYQLIMSLLQEGVSIEQRLPSSKARKKLTKPGKLKKEQCLKHARATRSFYMPTKLDDLEKENLLSVASFFNEVVNRNKEKNKKKLAGITAESPRTKKNLITDYYFCELKNLLRIRQGYYGIMADSPDKINTLNVDRIKINLTSLEDKITSMTNILSLVLLKKYIYPAFLANEGVLETTAKLYLEQFIDCDFGNNRTELKFLETDPSCKDFLPSHDVHRKFLSWHEKYVEQITASGLAALNEPLVFLDNNNNIITEFLSYSQLRATQLLREINKILSLGTLAATPPGAGSKSQMKSAPSFLNWYLDILARENPKEIAVLKQPYVKLGDEFRQFKKWFEELGAIHKRLDSLKSLFDHLEKNPKNINIKETDFIDWGEKAIHIEKNFNEIQEEVYRSPYIELVIAIYRMQPTEKEKFSIMCEKQNNSAVYYEILSVINFVTRSECAQEIIDLIPGKLCDKPLTGKFDCTKLDSGQLKTLGSCLITLIKAGYVKRMMQNYNFSERVARAEKYYREAQYYDFLTEYRTWLDHKASFYQMLQQSLLEFMIKENSLKIKLDNLKKNTIDMNFNSGDINVLQKKCARFKHYLKLINEAERASFALLKSVEDIFGELNHFCFETFCSTKKMLNGKMAAITLAACIEVGTDRLHALAKRANVTVSDINVDGVPDETELVQLKNKLNMLFLATKRRIDDAKNIKCKVAAHYNELLELKRIYEQQAIEYETLKGELTKQQQEFSQLCSHFENLFDVELIDSQQEIVSELFKRIKAVNGFILPAAPYSFIMAFKAKAQKITYLAAHLSSNAEHIEIEKYDRQFNNWSAKMCDYLNGHIKLLSNNSHSLLSNFLKINLDNPVATTVTRKEFSDLTDQNNLLLFQYRSLLELIEAYNYIGVNVSYKKAELENFYKTLRTNQEMIKSINDLIAQEDDNKSCATPTVAPTPIAKKTKTDDSPVKVYCKENEVLAREFSDTSRKILRLNLKVEESKNTIETLLPKITVNQGHDELAKLLKDKIRNCGAQIKSYESTIISLRARNTTLVKHALTSALTLLVDKEFMSQADVDFLKSVIAAEDYSDLSLTEIEDGQCTLQIDKKSSDERLALTIEVSDALPNAVIELLTIAIEGQSRQLDRGWSVNQTGFILDKIDNFLRTMSPSHYLESLQRIVDITLDVKKKINIFVELCKNRASLEQKNQNHNEIKMILIDLETKLDLLTNRFSTEPLLMLHLERLNIFAIRAMLINVITEQHTLIFNALDPTVTLPAVVSISDPDALAVVPFASNSSCFFVNSVPNSVATSSTACDAYLSTRVMSI